MWRSLSRKFWKGRSWSRVFYLRLRKPGYQSLRREELDWEFEWKFEPRFFEIMWNGCDDILQKMCQHCCCVKQTFATVQLCGSIPPWAQLQSRYTSSAQHQFVPVNFITDWRFIMKAQVSTQNVQYWSKAVKKETELELRNNPGYSPLNVTPKPMFASLYNSYFCYLTSLMNLPRLSVIEKHKMKQFTEHM